MTAEATIRVTDCTAVQDTVASTQCPYCRRSDTQASRTLSRHRTSTGETVWARCACGSLQLRIRDATGERIVTRTAPR